MIKFEKKQVKLISVAIALVFVFSIVAIAVSQTGSMGIASAASSSNVGIVDYRQVMSQHPDLAAANTEMQKESRNESCTNVMQSCVIESGLGSRNKK